MRATLVVRLRKEIRKELLPEVVVELDIPMDYLMDHPAGAVVIGSAKASPTPPFVFRNIEK
jgi:hypothetical protein